jgi:hypothetical protein
MTLIPPAVRILPMSSAVENKEFVNQSEEEVQTSYFLKELAGRENGYYLYHKRGITAEPGTVVLFQFKGKIIASATFMRSRKFDQPDKDGYSGTLHFDVKSIRVFDPVGPESLRRCWPKFEKLNQTKQWLDPASYPLFVNGLSGVQAPSLPKDQRKTN